MLGLRRLLMSLILVALMGLTAAVSSAAPGPQSKGNGKGKPAKARITWSEKRVERTLVPGQAARVEVTLTSSADLQNVSLRVPGGLGRIITNISPATLNLKANTPALVTLTIVLPTGATASQGGVVQVRMGQRNVPEPLKVLVRVPGDSGNDDEDGQGNANNKGRASANR